jgi:hypothetical protein
MLARSTKIVHPAGNAVETPLLVPSFSSKGLGTDRSGDSELKEIFSVASEYLTESMLVSAYDLCYKRLEPITNGITELTIVDSGGYEIADFHDLSSIYRQPVNPNDWRKEQLASVYDRWPSHVPAAFVSFDHPDTRIPLEEQVAEARSLFARYPHQLKSLLIKPETQKQQLVQVSNVTANVELLAGFNMIGFTEKEIGNTTLKRMINIAAIRLSMDDHGISTPIHIYGSLDPITSVLYFLSGAEVFDGLTWIRYGYADDYACYQHGYGIKKIGIDRADDFIKAKMLQSNLNHLTEMTHQMHKFLLDGDFGRFGGNAGFFLNSYDLLRTRNRRIT